MIVDCYTHTWDSATTLGRLDPETASPCVPKLPRAGGASAARHLAAAEPVGTSIVHGFKSAYFDAEISNDHVAGYVRGHAHKMIGFAGVDPSNPRQAITELRRAQAELGLRGVAVAPPAQDFHPSNSQAMLVYAEAAALGMPVLFHSGVHITSATKMEYARPALLDEVARELPNLRIVVAHLGAPWVAEMVTLIAKHENVFSETSWLLAQPWQAYQALLCAYEHGVTHKLLFGSGFPHASAAMCIEALYSINHPCHGTNLPTIPRECLRGIVERDSLALLGIAAPRPATPAQPAIAAEPSSV
jgi:hypothetical protein